VGLPVVAAIAILCLIIAGVAIWYLKPAPPSEPKRVMRSTYELPEDQQLFGSLDGSFNLAVSPDGSRFAYSTTKGIYIRSMSELDARLISGTDEDASSLFFSPDGQWIGYFSTTDQKLKSISVSGGAPTNLCDATFVFSAYWYEDNTIVYSDLASGVYRIPAKGGTPEVLVERLGVAGGHLLPDGQSVMFWDVTGQPPYKTMVQSLDNGEQKVVLESGAGIYYPTGHLVYWSENSMFAVPFDQERLELTGGAVSLMETPMGMDVSDSGTLVYVPRTAEAGGSSVSPRYSLVWVDLQGKETPLKADTGDYRDFKISPDGKGVALTVYKESNVDIWVLDLLRNNMRRLTFHVDEDNNPLWTPDSQRILFQRFDVEKSGSIIYSKAANGTGEEERLVSASKRMLFPWSWSNEGETLVLWELTLTPLQNDIGVAAMEGENLRESLLGDKKFNEGDPQVSPDGRMLAYHSDESGQFQVYVCSFPQVDKGKWQVSLNGGISPRWSPDGRKLYYRRENSIIAVDVETEPIFNPGNEEILFEGNYLTLNPNTMVRRVPWDVHPDGNKFLMMKEQRRIVDESLAEESEQAGPRKIMIVTNWIEELKERVPVD
jgi:serine/threonine-protein kinase